MPFGVGEAKPRLLPGIGPPLPGRSMILQSMEAGMVDQRAAAWAEIERLGARPGADAIRPLFAADPGRFARFHRRAGSLLLDFSKTAISDEVLAALLALARAADVEGRRAAMARGEAVNATENRAVLHIALRGHGGVAEAA